MIWNQFYSCYPRWDLIDSNSRNSIIYFLCNLNYIESLKNDQPNESNQDEETSSDTIYDGENQNLKINEKEYHHNYLMDDIPSSKKSSNINSLKKKSSFDLIDEFLLNKMINYELFFNKFLIKFDTLSSYQKNLIFDFFYQLIKNIKNEEYLIYIIKNFFSILLKQNIFYYHLNNTNKNLFLLCLNEIYNKIDDKNNYSISILSTSIFNSTSPTSSFTPPNYSSKLEKFFNEELNVLLLSFGYLNINIFEDSNNFNINSALNTNKNKINNLLFLPSSLLWLEFDSIIRNCYSFSIFSNISNYKNLTKKSFQNFSILNYPFLKSSENQDLKINSPNNLTRQFVRNSYENLLVGFVQNQFHFFHNLWLFNRFLTVLSVGSDWRGDSESKDLIFKKLDEFLSDEEMISPLSPNLDIDFSLDHINNIEDFNQSFSNPVDLDQFLKLFNVEMPEKNDLSITTNKLQNFDENSHQLLHLFRILSSINFSFDNLSEKTINLLNNSIMKLFLNHVNYTEFSFLSSYLLNLNYNSSHCSSNLYSIILKKFLLTNEYMTNNQFLMNLNFIIHLTDKEKINKLNNIINNNLINILLLRFHNNNDFKEMINYLNFINLYLKKLREIQLLDLNGDEIENSEDYQTNEVVMEEIKYNQLNSSLKLILDNFILNKSSLYKDDHELDEIMTLLQEIKYPLLNFDNEF